MNWQTLQAVVDCLIPPDDFPGANDAGVCNYLTRLLETDLSSKSAFFHSGLEAIDAEAFTQFQKSFHLLGPDEQIEILHTVESGDVATSWQIPPQLFFQLLVNTTAEGYYSDPDQGGNRDAMSWIMVGFEMSDML